MVIDPSNPGHVRNDGIVRFACCGVVFRGGGGVLQLCIHRRVRGERVAAASFIGGRELLCKPPLMLFGCCREGKEGEGCCAYCMFMSTGKKTGGCTQFVHGRSRMAVDPRIPTMPRRNTSGFQPGRHCLHQARSAVRCSATGGGRAYLFVACLSRLTIDHASLSRRSTVPTPNRDTSNIWAL